MKVFALARTSSLGPSSRYRIEQYKPLLSRTNIDVTSLPLFGATWFSLLELERGPWRALLKALYATLRLLARVGQVVRVRLSRADLVLVEQQLFPYLPAWVELLLWPRRQPTVLEFDDAIHLTPGHRRKLELLCARADLVIVGNEVLADFARGHDRRVVVIPTTLDLRRYEEARAVQRRRRAEGASTLRIGWIGLRYNFEFLEQIAAPLAQLAGSGRDVELRVISSGLPEASPTWGAVRLVHRPWSEEGEAGELGACDIGIMPLPDTPWAAGKCGLKLLQCMAAEVPVVASPVGVNRKIVADGQNGLLADDAAGWFRALSRLADDPALRARLGEAGRRSIEAGFCIEGGAEKVAEAYRLAAMRADGDGERTPPPAPASRR